MSYFRSASTAISPPPSLLSLSTNHSDITTPTPLTSKFVVGGLTQSDSPFPGASSVDVHSYFQCASLNGEAVLRRRSVEGGHQLFAVETPRVSFKFVGRGRPRLRDEHPLVG